MTSDSDAASAGGAAGAAWAGGAAASAAGASSTGAAGAAWAGGVAGVGGGVAASGARGGVRREDVVVRAERVDREGAGRLCGLLGFGPFAQSPRSRATAVRRGTSRWLAGGAAVTSGRGVGAAAVLGAAGAAVAGGPAGALAGAVFAGAAGAAARGAGSGGLAAGGAGAAAVVGAAGAAAAAARPVQPGGGPAPRSVGLSGPDAISRSSSPRWRTSTTMSSAATMSAATPTPSHCIWIAAIMAFPLGHVSLECQVLLLSTVPSGRLKGAVESAA